jgi:hypothetical protein
MAEVVRVRGHREFQAALKVADREGKRLIRARLRKAGDVIKVDARSRFAPVSAKSAAGFRTAVRARGISVEQSKRKTTGKHPEFGGLQMRRALIPALESNRGVVLHELNAAAEDIADIVRARSMH